MKKQNETINRLMATRLPRASFLLTLLLLLMQMIPASAQSKGAISESGIATKIDVDRATGDAAPPGWVSEAASVSNDPGVRLPEQICAPGAWSLGTPGPAARYRGGSATDGTFIYVFGGGNAAGAFLNDLWRWDPATGTWTQLANMPTGKQNIQGAYWNGKIYVPGGFATGSVHVTENAIYDIATNTWSTGAPLPATQTGTTVAFNNKIYVFGGNPGPQSTTRIYDIATNTWSAGVSMPVATTYGRSVVAGNFAYYVGGIAAATTNAVHRYDLMANSWTTVAPLQTARTSAEAVASPDASKLFVVMGGDASFFTGVPQAQSVEIYDIGANTWSYGNPVVTKAAAPSGGLASSKLMVQGGVDTATYLTAVQVSTVTPCVPSAVMTAAGATLQAESCGPANGVPDPGETVTVSFCVQNSGSLNTTNLVGTLQASGGVINPSGPQNYGAVVAGGAAVCRSFTFTVNNAAACGSSITASLQMQDGASDLGTLTYGFVTGTSAVVFSQNFDGVVAPALPAGWTSSATGIGVPWVTSTTNPASAPNDAFAPDPSNLADMFLVTPGFAVPAGGATISFKINYITEPGFDGAVLEFSTDGGATWLDITTGGNAFISGGYSATPISTGFASPIAGRLAWHGTNPGSPAYVTSSINTPAAANGQANVQLRWRMACDNSVAATGVRVDDISISNPVCATSCSTAPTPVSVVSRKAHGGQGNFDINLPLSGTSGVECRRGQGTGQNDHTIVVTFGSAPSVSGSPQATVTSGTGTIGSNGVPNGGAVTISGNTVTIPLTSVANAQVLTVTLNGVTVGAASGNVVIPMGMLLGDTNDTRSVNAGDALQTRGRSGQVTDGTNFRSDVNPDGTIAAGDVIIVRGQAGNSIP